MDSFPPPYGQYFTYSGLQTNIWEGPPGRAIGSAALIVTVAFGFKLLGATATARLLGFTNQEAWAAGALMNTRG
jgi:Kef-type K+ transport system membrane component KefB